MSGEIGSIGLSCWTGASLEFDAGGTERNPSKLGQSSDPPHLNIKADSWVSFSLHFHHLCDLDLFGYPEADLGTYHQHAAVNHIMDVVFPFEDQSGTAGGHDTPVEVVDSNFIGLGIDLANLRTVDKAYHVISSIPIL